MSPITSIDNRKVGNGEVGHITSQVKDLYFEVVKGKVERYKHWCKPVYGN